MAIPREATSLKRRRERERESMSRSEVKELLISLGVEEPTDEAISNYLNTIQKEVKGAEEKAQRYKDDAIRAKELQKQLDDLNSQNLSEVERANKATEDALREVESLKQTVAQMNLQKSLAEIGIIGEDATSLVGEDGSLNTEVLGKILTAREKNAVDVYKKQALESTPSPDGKKDEKPDEPYKDVVDRFAASRKIENEATSIVESYK